MKFWNLRKKLRNSALAVLFAVAVMFVMPAAAFADDTDVIDDTVTNVEVENGIEEIENNGNIDSTIDSGAELPAVTEDFVDYTENTEPEITDPFIPSDNCYGICCAACDENCNGACCDMCTIINGADDINVPDDSGYGFGNEFAGTDVPVDVGNENDNTEEGNLGNPNNEIVVDPTDEFTSSDEDITPVLPNEPIFPDDYYNNVIIPENPEDIYQPEVGNEFTDVDLSGNTDEDLDDENEIIYDDDLSDEEEEIIFGDDDLTDDENSEITDDSDSKNSDNASEEENSDNSGEENDDNSTDDENNDDSDIENPDDTANEDNSDNENSDNTADTENPDNSDSENSENITDENNPDDSDNAADEENPDDSDNEALEEDNNPVINVVLPVSISVVINPYNLNVVGESGFHYDISSPEYSIKNYSNCDVSIVATISASTEGGIVLSPHDLTGNETEFTAFAYIEATNESNVYSDNYNNSSNQIAFSNEAAAKEILTLADGSNGETVGYFRIKGQAVIPDGAQYSDQAMLNMVITFDIEPISKPVVSDDAVQEETTVENTENTENIESVENTENTESVENTENTENVEELENTENVEEPENTENVEDVESIENVQEFAA